MICDKKYRISYKLYIYFSCDKSEYYFIKKKHTHFKNYQLKKLKNERTLYIKNLIKNLLSDLKN